MPASSTIFTRHHLRRFVRRPVHAWSRAACGPCMVELPAPRALGVVMIDGRTVYTLLPSDVSCTVQDYVLEGIDQIEVVSGVIDATTESSPGPRSFGCTPATRGELQRGFHAKAA